jgi:hypothetical protein
MDVVLPHMFTRGDKGIPTMILEAVATRDLRIWHAFFGTAGSQNDINVLNKSPLFIQTIKGEAPMIHYNVNGTEYDMGYYLADRIYPEWAVFVKTVTTPQSAEDKLFALTQEGVRKDVKCALVYYNHALILFVDQQGYGSKETLST